MSKLIVGLMHPGEMGSSIGAAMASTGRTVHWASESRSTDSRERAARAGLVDVGTEAELCRRCGFMVSVCPPEAAEEVARSVAASGFRGTYLDANAISPRRSMRIGVLMSENGIEYVDGSIIGPPAWKTGTTRLYLSGKGALRAAELFSGTPVEARPIGEEVGRASALKMCFSAYSKGTTALLSGILALAAKLDMDEELRGEWLRDDAGFPDEVVERVRRVTRKAWRFVAEMEEIADTFRTEGLPGEFHEGAAALYRRLAQFKTSEELPSLETVLSALGSA